jgi:hypothetical protein
MRWSTVFLVAVMMFEVVMLARELRHGRDPRATAIYAAGATLFAVVLICE